MNANRFDRLARLLPSTPTRRGLVWTLAGVALGGALAPAQTHLTRAKKKKRSCGPCKIRKKGKCKKNRPNGADCGGNKICQNGVCGCFPSTRDCPDRCCPQGQVCHQSPSTTGQCANAGACPAQVGFDCGDPTITCNGRSDCFCSLATDQTIRCGAFNFAGTICGQCTDDDDCKELTDNPDAFCVSGSDACCLLGQKVCRLPCPA